MVLACVLTFALPARAVTFTVTKIADTNDGTCDNDCSLREAVKAASTVAGADSIQLSVNGTFVLTGVANEDANATGDLDVTSDVTINGNGPTNTILDGNNNEGVFDVFPGSSISFNLANLTIQNDNTSTLSFNVGDGLYLHNNATANISGCRFANNRGGSGAVEVG